MKKFLASFILLFAFLISSSCNPAGASLDFSSRAERLEIKRTLTELEKYSNEHNQDKIKTFYSKDYISHDGFDYNTFLLSIKETFQTYPDISYKSKIKSIDIMGDYAAVEITDSAKSTKQAVTQAIVNNKPVPNQKLNGNMESKSRYISFLKKTGGKWLIYSDDVITEETSIKYGNANDIDIKLYTPPSVKGAEQYTIKLTASKKPKNVIMLASLSKEEIKFPPALPNDIFRKVPSDGTLERIVYANKKGVNEYALASAGLTEISLNEERTAINYRMSGMAFLIKRVNVRFDNKAVNKEYVKKLLEKESL